MTANKRRWAWRGACLAVLAAGALGLAGWAANAGPAAPKGEAAGLDRVPADAAGMISVDFASLWSNPAYKATRDKIVKEAPDFAESFSKTVGVAPEDVERITGLLLSAEGPGAWATLITTAQPYDAKKVLAATAPESKEEKVKGRELHVNAKGLSVAFVTDRTYAVGGEAALRRYLENGEPAKEGPLAGALREAAGKHALVAGLDVQAVAKSLPPQPPTPVAAAIAPLFKARNALATMDLGDEAKADVRLTFEGELDAKNAEKAAESGLDLARAGLTLQIQQADKEPGFAVFKPVLESLQAGLRAAKIERSGADVTATASAKLDLGKAGPTLLDAVQKVREAAARTQGANNLKQLALAMHSYNDTYNHFPADAICDKDGKPLLSWRVAILPYVEQQELYKQFKLDEPWDSDNNKKLLDRMPKLFASPEDEQALQNHETHYQGFVGKGAFFDDKKGTKIAAVTDGTSNTIMLVEAKKAVPWTKPEDVRFDEGKLLPKVGGVRDRNFQAAMCDGAVRAIPMTIKEETLRAAITRNGGEMLGADW